MLLAAPETLPGAYDNQKPEPSKFEPELLDDDPSPLSKEDRLECPDPKPVLIEELLNMLFMCEALSCAVDEFPAEEAALNESPSEVIIALRPLRSEESRDIGKSFLSK